MPIAFHSLFSTSLALYDGVMQKREQNIKLEQQTDDCHKEVTSHSSSSTFEFSSQVEDVPAHVQNALPLMGTPQIKAKFLPNHKMDDSLVLSVKYDFSACDFPQQITLLPSSRDKQYPSNHCASNVGDIIAVYKLNKSSVSNSVAESSIQAIRNSTSMEYLARKGIVEVPLTKSKKKDTLHVELPSKKRGGTYIVVYMNQERRVLTCSSMLRTPPRVYITKIRKHNDLVVVDFEQETRKTGKPSCGKKRQATSSSQKKQQSRRASSSSQQAHARLSQKKKKQKSADPVLVKLVDSSNQILCEKECSFYRDTTPKLNAKGKVSFPFPFTKCCGFRVLLCNASSADPVFMSEWIDVHKVTVEREEATIRVKVNLSDTSLCGSAWVGIYEIGSRRSEWYDKIMTPKQTFEWTKADASKSYSICIYPGYFPVNPIYEKVELNSAASPKHELPAHLTEGL